MINDTFSVLIPDGQASVALHVVRCLAQVKGVNLYILSGKRWTWCRFTRHRQQYLVRPVETGQLSNAETMVDLVKQFNIDVILPVTQEGIEFAIQNYQTLATVAAISPVPEAAALNVAKDKWRLTEFARQLGVPVPTTLLVTADPAFSQQVTNLEYPIVFKPIEGYGGKGIKKFDTAAEFHKFLGHQDFEQLKNRSLVQSFVPGADLGVSVLCDRGQILAFTIQQGLMAQHLGPLKAMEFIKQPAALEASQRLLAALNWSGVAHIDMRYDPATNQVRILEINPRFWNSLLGSLVVGVNFPYLACLKALNLPLPAAEYRQGKYLHPGTGARELVLKLVGRPHINNFTFQETGLRFMLVDPWPDVMNVTAKTVRRNRNRWQGLPKASQFLDGFLADWYPDYAPRQT